MFRATLWAFSEFSLSQRQKPSFINYVSVIFDASCDVLTVGLRITTIAFRDLIHRSCEREVAQLQKTSAATGNQSLVENHGTSDGPPLPFQRRATDTSSPGHCRLRRHPQQERCETSRLCSSGRDSVVGVGMLRVTHIFVTSDSHCFLAHWVSKQEADRTTAPPNVGHSNGWSVGRP